MSSEQTNSFTKENLDGYLKELAKEYRRLNGKSIPAEIILIGGAAVLANYGFRNMTTDVDAIIQATSSMKDAINRVGDKFSLPNGWLNADFTKTTSYSPKLEQYSQYYRTFSNILTVRTVSAEYLIAMKLKSGRKYKHDLSDVIGILAEHQKSKAPITMSSIEKAVTDLYGGWDKLPSDSQTFIRETMSNGNFEEMYSHMCSEESKAKDLLVDFEKNYPGVTNTENVNTVLTNLKKKASLLEQIQKAKEHSSHIDDSSAPETGEHSL